MAAAAQRKKKLVLDRSGMSADTKRHFEHVKQKMFAFLDQRKQLEADGNSFTPPTPAPRRFVPDQNKALKAPVQHHRTPAPPRKHPHAPSAHHKQMVHLALATPQVARRVGV